MLIVTFLMLQLTSQSQFVLTARVDSIPTDSIEFCIGDTLDLDAVKTDFLMNNNFNNGSVGAGWSTNVTAMWTNPCAPTVLPASGVVLWFGSNIYPRELQTVNYDIHCYSNCYIEWDMKYGSNQNMTNCESPDEPSEGVHLQWSINNGTTWTQFVGEIAPSGTYGMGGYINGSGGYWTPVAGNAATGPYYSWNHYLTSLPLSAISNNTRFRWYQTLASGNTWDHWGIDNVQISCPTQLYVEWSCLELPFWHWYSMDPPPIILTQPGTYHYIVTIVDLTNNNHCNQSDTVVVKVHNPKVVINNGDTYESICFGDSTLLVAAGIGLSNYNWNITPIIYNDSIIASPNTTTSYIVNAKDNLGCIAKDTILVIVNPLPNIILNNDTICVGDTAILNASGGVGYLWSPGNFTTSTIKVKPLINTFYSVKVITDSNCYNFDTANVIVNPLPVLQLSNKTICFGDSLILTVGGGNKYLWNTLDTTQSIKIFPTSNTNYKVVVRDTNNCVDSTSALVEVIPLPIPGISKNADTICKGTPIILTATGGSFYHWNTNELTPSIMVYPQYTNTYSVDVSNSVNGINCKSNISILVDVIDCNMLYIPNSFSPFGYNTTFKPIGLFKVYTTYKFTIYNRWGQLIFETNSYDIGWDGKYKNQYVKSGAYVYHLVYQHNDIIYQKVGTVTVIY